MDKCWHSRCVGGLLCDGVVHVDGDGAIWTQRKGNPVTIDPIAHEQKQIAAVIFGEKLQHRTGDGSAAIENVAAALAAHFYPDDKALRDRFIGMCLDEPVIIQA